MNKAYTKEYKEYFQSETQHIKNTCTIQEVQTCELDFGYVLETREYLDKDNIERGIENRLMKDGKIINEWFAIDDSLLYYIFEHSDGNLYFLYHKELYGYSVLNLATLENMDYVPDTNEETFIWCKASYNKFNNMIAVDGCYWACPSTVILADFSNPLQAVSYTDWKEVQESLNIDKNYDFSHDISFIAWHQNNIDLKVSCYTGDLFQNH